MKLPKAFYFAAISISLTAFTFADVLESEFGPIDLTGSTREHHHLFCKVSLPLIPVDHGIAGLDLISKEDSENVKRLFDWVGSKVDESERISSEGITTRWIEIDPRSKYLIVEPPRPKFSNECAFIVFGVTANGVRTFGLEIGSNLNGTEILYYLVEYLEDGRANYGSGWPYVPDKLVTALHLKLESEQLAGSNGNR